MKVTKIMAEKWYNSLIANGIGASTLIFSIAYSSIIFMKGCSSAIGINDGLEMVKEIEMEKMKNNYLIKEADLNGNDISDKFYVIDGKVAVVELDGKPIINRSLDSEF